MSGSLGRSASGLAQPYRAGGDHPGRRRPRLRDHRPLDVSGPTQEPLQARLVPDRAAQRRRGPAEPARPDPGALPGVVTGAAQQGAGVGTPRWLAVRGQQPEVAEPLRSALQGSAADARAAIDEQHRPRRAAELSGLGQAAQIARDGGQQHRGRARFQGRFDLVGAGVEAALGGLHPVDLVEASKHLGPGWSPPGRGRDRRTGGPRLGQAREHHAHQLGFGLPHPAPVRGLEVLPRDGRERLRGARPRPAPTLDQRGAEGLSVEERRTGGDGAGAHGRPG